MAQSRKPHNRGTRRKPNYCGPVSYKGHRRFVSGCKSVEEFNEKADVVLERLREEVDGPGGRSMPTVAEFAGATFHENGRVSMVWPDGQLSRKADGRTPKSVQRMREGLKPFLREFRDRRLDSFSRDEALTWVLPVGPHVQQSVRQFFNHAKDRELIADNKFARLGVSKKKRRVDRPDFEIVSDEKYELLQQCARRCREDDYALVIEGIVICEGETAMRPSEIFGLHEEDVDLRQGEIYVRYQYDSLTRKRVPTKDQDTRWVAISPKLRAHLEIMPRHSPPILFPAVRGGYYSLANFSPHWKAVRVAAGMPGMEFYELKHRALQWMIDPVEEGGLGLDHQTAALMAGHDDGGWLLATVYTKLSERNARQRALEAMRAYELRHRQRERDQHPHLYVVRQA
jgi:integrase